MSKIWTGERMILKVWITKYALTKGLFEMEAEIVDGKYASGKYESIRLFTRDWAHTLAEAVKVAEDMRTRRIASLKKSIVKLERLNFQ